MAKPRRSKLGGREPAYAAPGQSRVTNVTLGNLLHGIRSISEEQQQRLGFKEGKAGVLLWCVGDLSLVKRRCVSVVGTRDVSEFGAKRARRLARELSEAGAVVASGLAKGVDTEALTACIAAGGRVIAVIGTPVDRAYPNENATLQQEIYTNHLLISQFEPGRRVYPSNFPERNKLMAAISDATVIVEASEQSGTLHQAAECVRLGRWLFIARSVIEAGLKWPSDFLDYPNVRILTETSDLLDALQRTPVCR